MEKMNEAVYLISLKTEVSLSLYPLNFLEMEKLKKAAIHLSFIHSFTYSFLFQIQRTWMDLQL